MKVFGLIGEKLSHSLSPVIHRKIYEQLSLDAAYSLFQVQPGQLGAAIGGIRALNINGCNVTIPYKIDTMSYLDSVSKEAADIGAINTIVNSNGHLTGYNTDYMGFGRLLSYYAVDVKSKTAVVLGSGGASKAVIAYLAEHDASDIFVVSRAPIGNEASSNERVKVIGYQELADLRPGGLLVNCTPVGMAPNSAASPVPKEVLLQFDHVVDLIYNPAETRLMLAAAALGLPAYNGLYMLVAQAVSAVELWIGQTIEESIITEIFVELQTHIRK